MKYLHPCLGFWEVECVGISFYQQCIELVFIYSNPYPCLGKWMCQSFLLPTVYWTFSFCYKYIYIELVFSYSNLCWSVLNFLFAPLMHCLTFIHEYLSFIRCVKDFRWLWILRSILIDFIPFSFSLYLALTISSYYPCRHRHRRFCYSLEP